jgi:hypothetical protein
MARLSIFLALALVACSLSAPNPDPTCKGKGTTTITVTIQPSLADSLTSAPVAPRETTYPPEAPLPAGVLQDMASPSNSYEPAAIMPDVLAHFKFYPSPPKDSFNRIGTAPSDVRSEGGILGNGPNGTAVAGTVAAVAAVVFAVLLV